MTLIKSAQVIDGTGRKPFRADVLVKKDRISAIGNFPDKKADNVINGLGMYLAPGFIDIQSSADHYLGLFTNPAMKDFLLQGVTTAIGGHCGSSLAPLLYGTLESIQKWSDPNLINVNWHSVREFLDVVRRRKLGINFGTLTGHSTIRRALIGEEVRDLSPSELKVFQCLVRESLQEGSFGLSTGLGYVHSHQTPFNEVEALAGIVAKMNGVYSTHLRDEQKEIEAAVQETITLTKKTGVRTLISHFHPIIGFEKEYQKAFRAIESSRQSADIHFNNYPFNTSIVPIYTLLPRWAQTGGRKIMLENLEAPDIQKRIIKEFKNLEGVDIRISQVAHNVSFRYLIGKTLKDFAENQGLDIPAALIKLMRLTKMKAVVFIQNVNLDLTIQSLASPAAMITANSAGLADNQDVLKHERFLNTFPKFLQIFRARDILPMEEMIRKITGEPAEMLGLRSRGVVRDGNFADLVLFSVASDNQFNIENVFVNGVQVIKNREFLGLAAGKVLSKK